LKDPGFDERMIFKCTLKIGCEGMDCIRLIRDTCRVLGDEPVGPIKSETFLDYLKNLQLSHERVPSIDFSCFVR